MRDCAAATFLSSRMKKNCPRCERKKSHEHHFMRGRTSAAVVTPSERAFCDVDASLELCSIFCDIYTIWRNEKRKKRRRRNVVLCET